MATHMLHVAALLQCVIAVCALLLAAIPRQHNELLSAGPARFQTRLILLSNVASAFSRAHHALLLLLLLLCSAGIATAVFGSRAIV